MAESISHLTTASLLAEAGRCLEQGGYRVSRDIGDPGLSGGRSVLAEDAYGVVMVIAYETVSDLLSGWTEAQGAFVELMSHKLTKLDPKIWEGYLVLMTHSTPNRDTRHEVETIRHDTSYIRKLVATGDDIKAIGDVERLLFPLLPLDVHGVGIGPSSLLDSLPVLLSRHGIGKEAANTVVEAFKKKEHLLESLYRSRKRK